MGESGALRGLIYVPTHTGELLAVSAANGEVVWRIRSAQDVGVSGDRRRPTHPSHLRLRDPWPTPCRPRHPERLWTVELPESGEIESTPIVWDGTLYVGSRNGYFYAVGG